MATSTLPTEKRPDKNQRLQRLPPRTRRHSIRAPSREIMCSQSANQITIAGEIPKAFIVLKEGMAASAEEIMTFVNDQVAPYKAIREVEFRKELPISSAGKVLRRLLKEKV